MAVKPRPSYLGFDKPSYAWKAGIDYRVQPELYRVGKGEQGVLICEPYKTEILPHWRFADAKLAKASAEAIHKLFYAYLKRREFVGADMARKFLQMGFTRARRYANYAGGRKYDKDNNYALRKRGTGDPGKAESAAIFYEHWQEAEAEPRYAALKADWKTRFG